MNTHIRDELVEINVHRHLQAVQTSAAAACVMRPRPVRGAQFAQHRDRVLEHEDDAALQEGSARFRVQQTEYERHTHEVDGARYYARVKPPTAPFWRSRVWHVASSIGAGILFAIAVLLVTAWLSRAHAQDVAGPLRVAQATTSTPILVRACNSTPTGSGFGACANSVWAAPAPNLVLDVLRASVIGDAWITSDQLVTTDRVFACEDASVQPGPFVTCPSFLPGQQNNYLAETAINFGAPAPVAPLGSGTLKLSWQTVTTDDEASPQPVAAGTAVSYAVFVRSNNCTVPVIPAATPCQSTYPSTPTTLTAATSVWLPEQAGPWCAVIAAFWLGSDPTATAGAISNEGCANVVGKTVKPAQVLGLTVTGQ